MPNLPELKDAEAIVDTVDMLNARCMRLADSGNDGDAIKCYDTMMKAFGPSYGLANFMKGFVLIKKGKYEEAKKCFEESEKITPGTAEVKIGMAICEARLGQKGNARGLLTAALELSPKDVSILVSASMLFYEMGEKKNGEDYMKQAMDINPYAAVSRMEAAAEGCLSDSNISQEDKKKLRQDMEDTRKLLDNLKAEEAKNKKKKK